MIDTKNYTYELKDEILHCTFKCKILSAQIAEKAFKSIIELIGNKDQYIVVDAKSLGY